jgi:hypothetical protein
VSSLPHSSEENSFLRPPVPTVGSFMSRTRPSAFASRQLSPYSAEQESGIPTTPGVCRAWDSVSEVCGHQADGAEESRVERAARIAHASPPPSVMPEAFAGVPRGEPLRVVVAEGSQREPHVTEVRLVAPPPRSPRRKHALWFADPNPSTSTRRTPDAEVAGDLR